MVQKLLNLEDRSQGHQFSNSCDQYLVQCKIQNASKKFTRNHADDNTDNDNDGTKNNMSLSGRGGGRHNYISYFFN